MNKSDRNLGMGTDISRRDFLNGCKLAVGASLLPGAVLAQDSYIAAQDVPNYYPPEFTGMRGSHSGSFETAHQARDGASFNGSDNGERYDLVVVGAGISGLSAAHFYQQARGANSKILILENHDDFGGHAKRNEFQIDSNNVIGYGGSMLLEAPGYYPAIAKKLLEDLGIETQRFYRYFDQDFYSSMGLYKGEGIFFDAETFGVDHLAVGDWSDPSILAQAPLSTKARGDLQRLFKDERHYLPEMPTAEQSDYLQKMDYRSYLKNHAAMDEGVLDVMQSYARGVWAVAIDALPARIAWSSGYPGFGNLDLGFESYDREGDQEEPSIFHFPDGNASVARLLVRKMIPAVAIGDTMEDIVTSRFDYSQLDEPNSPIKIRLNSTVVSVQHIDDNLSNPVKITYVRDGKTHVIESNQVIMACYNQMIPHLCPEMPRAQKSALANCIRAPLVYTNVLLRNWHSFVNLGIHRAYCPGSYHHRVMLDYPVSLGDYQFSKSPTEPIVAHLTRAPGESGSSARDQFAAGKRDLLVTTFETFERNIRDQLSRLLGPGGFNPAQDIAAITVNRWPHGYAYGYDPDTDQVAFDPDSWPAEKRVWVNGSRRFGNISIASSDSASNAMAEAAIGEAHRAVNDLN